MISKYINDWLDIIEKMNNDNTYKLAWGRALLECISFDKCYKENAEKVFIKFEDIAECMIKYYWNQMFFFNLKQSPLKVHKLCKENNARALLEFVTPYEEDIDIAVEFNSDKIKYDGIIYIIDDNGEALLQSYLWIAYRLNGGNLDKYLSLFKIKYKKES